MEDEYRCDRCDSRDEHECFGRCPGPTTPLTGGSEAYENEVQRAADRAYDDLEEKA